MHIEKFSKASFQGLLLHCDRTFKNHSNECIDKEKSHLNYNLAKEKKTAKEVLEFAQKHMRGNKKIRDNINVVVGACVTLPQGIDPKHKDEVEMFFQVSFEFLKYRYCGGKNESIVSSYVHLDETTPHMHFLFIPIDKEGKLSAKNVISKKDLQSLHQDYDRMTRAIFKRDVGVVNGATKDRKNLDIKEFKELKEQEKAIKNELKKKTEEVQKQENDLQTKKEAFEKKVEVFENLKTKEKPKLKKKAKKEPDAIFGHYKQETYQEAVETANNVIERYNGLVDEYNAQSVQNALLEHYKAENERLGIESLKSTLNELKQSNEMLEEEKRCLKERTNDLSDELEASKKATERLKKTFLEKQWDLICKFIEGEKARFYCFYEGLLGGKDKKYMDYETFKLFRQDKTGLFIPKAMYYMYHFVVERSLRLIDWDKEELFSFYQKHFKHLIQEKRSGLSQMITEKQREIQKEEKNSTRRKSYDLEL